MTQEEKWLQKYTKVKDFTLKNHMNQLHRRIEDMIYLTGLKRRKEKAGYRLADYSMSDRIWNRVYSYGGKVSLFQEWDRCLKLRKGLVGHLKDLGCPRSLFINLTPDTKLNESLLAIYDKMS